MKRLVDCFPPSGRLTVQEADLQFVTSAQKSKRIVPRIHPPCANASGSAKRPTPTRTLTLFRVGRVPFESSSAFAKKRRKKEKPLSRARAREKGSHVLKRDWNQVDSPLCSSIAAFHASFENVEALRARAVVVAGTPAIEYDERDIRRRGCSV